MSGSGQTQSQVQTKDPYGPAVPYLNQIMSSAANNYNNGIGTYNGPYTAPLSTQTNLGINGVTNVSNTLAQSSLQPYNYALGNIQNNGLTSAYNAPLNTYGDVTQSAGSPTAASKYLTGMANGSQSDNPYLQAALAGNDARIKNLVNSQFAGMGRYGSDANGVGLATALANSDNPILAQAYSDQQNRQLTAAQSIDQSQRAAEASQLAAAGGQAGIYNFGQSNAANLLGQIPSLQNAAYTPNNATLGVGGLLDQYNQQVIQGNQQQAYQPWQQLNNYLGSVSGLGGLIGNAGTTTGNINQTTTPGALDYLKLFGGGNTSPVQGLASAGSALLGFLSDRNEKTDIKKLGTDQETGLGIYAYRYKGDPKTYPKMVGPMAQEVERRFPGSTEKVGGKLYIRNDALGIAGLVKKAA